MTTVSLNLNGKAVSADVPDNTLLVSFIRETMSMTGTHVGCDTSQCGACVVHVCRLPGVWAVSVWCPSVSLVSLWCLWCLSGVSLVSPWCLSGVSLVSLLALS